jgi:hypothetical protein
MKWRRPVVKKGGKRKQFQKWHVPPNFCRQFGLEDGSECAIAISFEASVREAAEQKSVIIDGKRRYVLTSGKEFHVPKPIAERLRLIAENKPKSEIVFDMSLIRAKLNAIERRDLRRLFDKAVMDVQASEGLTPDAARYRAFVSILQRPGQVRFRNNMLRAYGGTCAISECDYPEALEAAHIDPYAKGGTNEITNGLLLRADLHRLFDGGRITIDPTTRTVIASSELKKTVYESLHGKPLQPPMNPKHRPKFPAGRSKPKTS